MDLHAAQKTRVLLPCWTMIAYGRKYTGPDQSSLNARNRSSQEQIAGNLCGSNLRNMSETHVYIETESSVQEYIFLDYKFNNQPQFMHEQPQDARHFLPARLPNSHFGQGPAKLLRKRELNMSQTGTAFFWPTFASNVVMFNAKHVYITTLTLLNNCCIWGSYKLYQPC